MSDITIIDETMVEVQYTPTTTQMEIKKKFWAKYKSQTGYKVGDVPSRAIIQRIVKNQASTVYKQWDTPGFKEWFLNDTKFEQILYEHEEEVLIRLLSIIKDPEAKNGDKLKAMGMYLEMSGLQEIFHII